MDENAPDTDGTDYAVSPGSYLQEWLDETGTTLDSLSEVTRITIPHLEQLLAGDAPVTSGVALRLFLATGIRSVSWVSFETQYRSTLARLAAAKSAD